MKSGVGVEYKIEKIKVHFQTKKIASCVYTRLETVIDIY